MSLLVATDVSKSFAGTRALDAVSIEVGAEERVGLIGPNGAGKTTFFNCLLGMLRTDGGSIVFDDADITHLPPYRRARLGFGRTFQRIEVFVGLTVREHFLVADRVREGTGRLWKDVLNRGGPTAAERERADRMLELLGLDALADRPVETLTLGQCRLVEVGRALMGATKLLLLDEPSSGLDRRETEQLADTLARVQADHRFSILLVEHDVDFVRSFVSRLYVLDAGALIAQGPTDDVLADAEVRRAYLGGSA